MTSDHDLEFTKMAGGGNDFVVIDVRERIVEDPTSLAIALCTRRLSVGADGLILVDQGDGADVRMLYYNADGSRADFCANGTRCAVRFAFLNEIAPARMTIEADCGILDAQVHQDGRVTLAIDPPHYREQGKTLAIGDQSVTGTWLQVGVPHFVIEVEEDIWGLDISGTGPAVRSHPDLESAGANANFVRVKNDHEIEIRTWERGVEGETLSCGSGVTASVGAMAVDGKVTTPVKVKTRSGITYDVELEDEGKGRILLTGDARVVFQSVVGSETLRGFDPDWVRSPSEREPRTDG